ncbi:DUF4288 domain-containing protein [Kovacikia minuta CCNUW1]|uniref:DUF4288 domain-containing protein n=1 Tax=Kovacikia minuta TaxID=2931930 RepID=UPI001CCF479C|nr:DUF4288 domain-containing protein [Kovacikia minuta]UBF28297.1 DUF4288 domain-containing protein [Kovacikia minuta CCNUW1]
MAYIPDDAKWYIAEIVMECQVEGNSRNVVHTNIVLVRADSPEEAFEKAEELGRGGEDRYLNTSDQEVTFQYRGLRELNVIHDELEHGAELMYEEEIGVQEDELKAMISLKSDLAVFRDSQPRASDYPNYSSKEIMEQVNQRMRGEKS